MKLPIITIVLAFLATTAFARQYPPGTLPNTVVGLVELQSGQKYTQTLTVGANDTTITTYGGTAKAILVGRIECSSKDRFTLKNIKVDGEFRIKGTGVRITRGRDHVIEDNEIIRHLGNGLSIEGYGGIYVTNARYIGNVIADNRPNPDGGHCQGVYTQYCKGVLKGNYNVFDTNGWNGTSGQTAYNHNRYDHAVQDGWESIGNIYRNASNYGHQQRAGGDSKDNIFIGNRVHHSHGYIKGSPIKPGGVVGEITNNWYISGREYGWCVDLGNLKQVFMHHCYFMDDPFPDRYKAINVKDCEDIRDNKPLYLDDGQWDIRIEDITSEWVKGVLNQTADNPKTARLDLKFPINANALQALGPNFMNEAKANPRGASALGISRLRQATGLDQPPPQPALTLEQAIRNPPGPGVMRVEEGKAVIRFEIDGTDPLWYVEGNTVTPR